MKSLFVPMVLGRFEKMAVETAVALAILHDATVDVSVGFLAAVPPIGDSDCFPASLSDALRASADAEALAIAAAAMQSLAEVRHAVRLPDAFRPAPSGRTFSGAGAADLIVLGRPRENTGADDRLFASLLLGSGRPVLVVPDAANRRPGFGRVLIAWRPVREATRSIHDAIPLLKQAHSVRIIRVLGDDEEVPCNDGVDRALVDHLEQHGVRPVSECLQRYETPKGERILDAARVMSADLIVAGGYGFPKVYEHVFGGVTRSLLHRSDVPVLFSH